MTWCDYRKLGLETPRPRALTVGASSGVDLGSVLLIGAGLFVVVSLVTSNKRPGFGR